MSRKTVNCPHCGQPTIEICHVNNKYWGRQGFVRSHGKPAFSEGCDKLLTPVCSACGKKYEEKDQADHAKRLEQIRSQGLPTRIES
jgi:DNA-directed RNA polymerase subunit RPC12/RpoP